MSCLPIANGIVDPKCASCTALCCRYIALEIDRPRTERDFEDLRWYLLHEKISIFVDGKTWFLNVETRCKALGADNLCTIYETRPAICREYKNDFCDKDGGEFDLLFETPEELMAYKAKMERQRRRKARKRTESKKARPARSGRAVWPRRPSAR
jgi:Fe-S-cluster containining protein